MVSFPRRLSGFVSQWPLPFTFVVYAFKFSDVVSIDNRMINEHERIVGI
jgi:hypothetical protein